MLTCERARHLHVNMGPLTVRAQCMGGVVVIGADIQNHV